MQRSRRGLLKANGQIQPHSYPHPAVILNEVKDLLFRRFFADAQNDGKPLSPTTRRHLALPASASFGFSARSIYH